MTCDCGMPEPDEGAELCQSCTPAMTDERAAIADERGLRYEEWSIGPDYGHTVSTLLQRIWRLEQKARRSALFR